MYVNSTLHGMITEIFFFRIRDLMVTIKPYFSVSYTLYKQIVIEIRETQLHAKITRDLMNKDDNDYRHLQSYWCWRNNKSNELTE